MCSLHLEKYAEATTVPSVKKSVIDNLNIPLLSLVDQHHIAAVLDKVSDVIRLRKQQLAKLDELIKARFVEMFGDIHLNPKGWHFKPLSELCDVRDGTHESPEYYAEGYPLLTSKNFTNGYINFSECNFVAEKDFHLINQRSKVDFGDIVMPMIGTIGHPVIIDTTRPFAIKNVALIKFQHSDLSNIFVKEVLDSDYFINLVKEKNRGNTQKFIALGDIRGIMFPVVPKELQSQFASFVAQVDKSKSAVQKSLDETQLLFDSLMQKFFG